jgi:biotin operon repressor
MSGLVMGRVFYTDLPAHLKLTLLALADHAEDDGTGIFVGQARLARKTGASERAVRGHIAELRELGLIEKVGRVGSRGSDKHRVVVESLPTSEQIALMFPGPRPAEVADRQKLPTGAAASSRPATQRSSTGNSQAAEPSVEPSEEPSGRPARKRDLIHDALAEIEGADSAQLTRPHARRIAVAAAAIRAATPDVSSAQVHLRAEVYRRLHPEWELTANALASHWASVSGARTAPVPGGRSRRMSEFTTDELEAMRG